MSAPHAADHSLESESQFDKDELRQFDDDDSEAGRAIGKMLSVMFLYTVLVMALSTYVTFRWVYGG